MATQLILANADKLASVDLAEITGLPLPYYGRSDMCFFLERELSLTKKQAIEFGVYRHLKPYRGRFLDYIAKKEFATLEDWVTDCGSSMDKIMFGFSRFDGYRTYIRLEELINYFTPTCQDMDELTKFAQKLSIDELSLKNVMVRTRTVGLLTYAEYMEG
ncbi:MAG: hypothetical protein EB127_13645 [Alphaproteobacteria bacterium]|nr:hypothetical protein [Alphaproteobacteria bacterium]